VASFKVGYLKFDKTGGFSPVPVLFSADPQQALDTIKSNPVFLEDCIQLLASKLVIREELTIEEAEAFIGAPRAGRVVQPLLDLWKKAKARRLSVSKTKTPKEDTGETS